MELDFVPSEVARGLVSRRSGLLGILVPDLADPHYPHIARGAEEVARASGMALVVCNTLGDQERLAAYLQVLRARRVDAVVVSGGGSLTPQAFAVLAHCGLPAVLIGRPPGFEEMTYVAVENVGAGEAATRHLLDTGRRRIVHLGGPERQTTMADRAAGYRHALDGAGLEVRIVVTDGSAETGRNAMLRLLELPPGDRPDAVFAATDRLAIAAMHAALDHGASVPEDVAFIGFDDLPVAEYLRPPLASVAQPGQMLGEEAIRLATALAVGERVESVVLPARLIVRRSAETG